MPYILNTDTDTKQMLKTVRAASVDDLFKRIPSQIRLAGPLNIPQGVSEMEAQARLEKLSEKNARLSSFNSFLGAGCYDHYVPAVSGLLSGSPFVTAYTPYQAECSQGTLQAIYEYQTYLCILTGMDVSNASLLDGASALAEAALMALRLSGRRKIIIAGMIHPEYEKTLRTYVSGFDFEIETLAPSSQGIADLPALKQALDARAGCLIVQSPNFFGLIEEAEQCAAMARAAGAVMVMVTNPLSLAVFKEPAALGVDIVCGDGQPLGGNLNFGGPSFGFLATKNEFLRQIPGRIVGKTTDAAGNTAFCLTLQTREQHIRREKATSNICSNHSLNVIAALLYLALMGRQGLLDAAVYSMSNTRCLYKRLKEVRGVSIPFAPNFFNEFLWEVNDAQAVLDQLRRKRIIAGYFIGNHLRNFPNGIISCCTEKKMKSDIDLFVNTLGEILHG